MSNVEREARALNWCSDCGTHHWSGGSCYPLYRAYHDDDDDGVPVRARTHDEAAERFAEEYDNGGDYAIINGYVKKVRIVDSTGVEEWFELSGEMVPQYHARPLSE